MVLLASLGHIREVLEVVSVIDFLGLSDGMAFVRLKWFWERNLVDVYEIID